MLHLHAEWVLRPAQTPTMVHQLSAGLQYILRSSLHSKLTTRLNMHQTRAFKSVVMMPEQLLQYKCDVSVTAC